MYSPNPPPFKPDVGDLLQYVYGELQAIANSQASADDILQLNVLHNAPNKPRDGMVVCADGTHWQPLGAGGGFFGYYGGAWVKLNN